MALANAAPEGVHMFGRRGREKVDDHRTQASLEDHLCFRRFLNLFQRRRSGDADPAEHEIDARFHLHPLRTSPLQGLPSSP
jgi:hypothetical protein